MTRPRSPHLDCLPSTADGPQDAQQSKPGAAVGARRDVAVGALSALGPNPPRGDWRYPVAWLHITAPRGAVPTATSRCACGRDRSAVGHERVHALIADHTAHRDTCPLRTNQEGRNAA